MARPQRWAAPAGAGKGARAVRSTLPEGICMRPIRSAANALLAISALTAAFSMSAARADGDPAPTYQRERAAQKFKDCHWTDEMGKYVYQCIKKNDGLNAHWCYD